MRQKLPSGTKKKILQKGEKPAGTRPIVVKTNMYKTENVSVPRVPLNSQSSETKRYCAKCGIELPLDFETKICSKCQYQKTRTIVICGVITIVAVATIGYIAYKNREKIYGYLGKEIPKENSIKEATKAVADAKRTANKITVPQSLLSKIDKQKIELATKTGKITEKVVDAYRYDLEQGNITVDELLTIHNAKEILSQFVSLKDVRNTVTVEEVKRAVEFAAKELSCVDSINWIGNDLEVKFISNSKKNVWGTVFTLLNEDGKLSDQIIYYPQYKNASVPINFIRAFNKYLKYIVESRE